MCTSIISNGNKTIIGFNLDILDMEYRVVAEEDKVYIAIHDDQEGWLPLFGANSRGNTVFIEAAIRCFNKFFSIQRKHGKAPLDGIRQIS